METGRVVLMQHIGPPPLPKFRQSNAMVHRCSPQIRQHDALTPPAVKWGFSSHRKFNLRCFVRLPNAPSSDADINTTTTSTIAIPVSEGGSQNNSATALMAGRGTRKTNKGGGSSLLRSPYKNGDLHIPCKSPFPYWESNETTPRFHTDTAIPIWKWKFKHPLQIPVSIWESPFP